MFYQSGDRGVGKSSLVKRFLHRTINDDILATFKGEKKVSHWTCNYTSYVLMTSLM